MWIKACLNGDRPPGWHPALPVTPGQLARAAAGAVAAGAAAVHLHPRGADGTESLSAADVGAAVAAVRAACPGTPVGVGTGLWITGGDVAARAAAVAGWAGLAPARRPDFASVNASEDGFADLAGTLRAGGIAVEAGVWAPDEAARVTGVEVLRVLVEIIGGPAGTAVPRARAVLSALDDAGVTGPRLLHGEEAACWPLVAEAGRLGLPTRIGLEDTGAGPDGTAVTGNDELVRLAVSVWRSGAAAGPGSPR